MDRHTVPRERSLYLNLLGGSPADPTPLRSTDFSRMELWVASAALPPFSEGSNDTRPDLRATGRLVLVVAVAQTGPQNGPSIGRGITAVERFRKFDSVGTTPVKRGKSHALLPPVGAQPCFRGLCNSLRPRQARRVTRQALSLVLQADCLSPPVA